ncbi:MAG: hypothetical protein M3163_01290 [Actinomycetota bacterium]|nr:hypothetical protein [Actinomycetota bacterium]
MSDLPPEVSRRNNRANWVGLRTLRQVPRIVGQTTTGDDIFEVRSVRLVLPADGTHFNRIVDCAACGREVPGPPVLTAADLDQGAHGVICGDCAKPAEPPTFPPKERRPVSAQRRALGDVSRDAADNGHGPVRASDDGRLAALEQRMAELTEAVGALSGSTEDRLAEGLAGVLVREDELSRVQDEMGGRLVGLAERLAEDAESERGRLGALESRLGRLEVTADLMAPPQPPEAEVAANGAPGSGRLQALEHRLHDAVRRVTEALDAQRAELRDGLRQGLDQVRSMVAEEVERLNALEQNARQRDVEVSEIRDLQMVLDAGMGELRSGLEAVRDGNTQLADAQADVERRLEALAQSQPTVKAEPGGRVLGRRSADAVAVSAAVEDLAREQQRLSEQLTSLEQATDTLAAEASKASTRAAATVPLRRDVKALHEQLAAQNEAVDALRRSVESLSRKVPARAPAAKRAPRATKS